MHSATIAHAKLRLFEKNVRKTNGDPGFEALASSIAEHGLFKPDLCYESRIDPLDPHNLPH